MQGLLGQLSSFDTHLPGTPQRAGDMADYFPYHLWGRGSMPKQSARGSPAAEELRRADSARRRQNPTCIEEACAYGNLPYLILAYAQGRFHALKRRAIYEGSDASPLMWAAFKGHLDCVKFLIDAALRECAELSTEARGGGIDAATPAHAARARPASDAEADPGQVAFHNFINFTTSLGHTALQWAIISGETAIVRILLDHNANPFQRDRQGFDAGFVAVQNGHLMILLMLLEDSMEARAITLVPRRPRARAGDGDGAGVGETETLVNVAVGHGGGLGGNDSGDEGETDGGTYEVNMDLIRYLNGEAATAAEAANWPPRRTIQCRDGSFTVNKNNYYYLDPALRDGEGHSLMHWCAYRNSPATCQYLVERWRFDVNVQDAHGRSPMIWAAREGFAEVIEYLCLHGGDRQLSDREGFTALQYARARNHPEAAHVLSTAPAVDLAQSADAILDNPQVLKRVQAYVPVRVRRSYGTLRMIFAESLFALQAAMGAVYMVLAYVSLCLIPPVFSYFPFGVYFFKNMLWVALVGNPYQSSKDDTPGLLKEVGLASNLAESVRGSWRFRLREPANLTCVTLLMVLQMFCWSQLGLTPFVSGYFSFNFLLRPFSAGTPSTDALARSALRAGRCDTHGGEGPWCDRVRLGTYLLAHQDAYARIASGSPRLLGSGANVLAEVADVTALLSRRGAAGAATREGDPYVAPGDLFAHQLFDSASYAGGRLWPLRWVFGDDGLAMVGTVLPLLFTLTLLCFALTKLTAHRSVMSFTPINDRYCRRVRAKSSARRGGGGGGSRSLSPYKHEGTLARSPLWRILKSRAYTWLNPRALMLERHTQIPCRAFYCPEQDIIVHRYDGYSTLLDCPIGARNHLFFVLGITSFTLFQLALFAWGTHQMNFFFATTGDVACRHEAWSSGAFAAFSPSETLHRRMFLPDELGSVPRAPGMQGGEGGPANARGDALAQHAACTGVGQSVVNLQWLNDALNLFIHGLPHKQNHYIADVLLPSYVTRTHSLLRRVLFIFFYYLWPTRANTHGAFLVHFSAIAAVMGAATAWRQWSGVWRGATRMELANPLTPCHNFGGRLVTIFSLRTLLASGGLEVNVEAKSGGPAAATAAGGQAELLNYDEDEEAYYMATEPTKARQLRKHGVGLFDKCVYADSQWSLVNVFRFLLGRSGGRWEGAMAISDSLKPVQTSMLAEFE